VLSAEDEYRIRAAWRKGAAFGEQPGVEVGRILQGLAEKMAAGAQSGSIHDENGKTVGTFSLRARTAGERRADDLIDRGREILKDGLTITEAQP
jgi:hypothetical protein